MRAIPPALVVAAALVAMACGQTNTDCSEIVCFTDDQGGYGLGGTYVVGTRIEVNFSGPVGDVSSSNPEVVRIGGRDVSGSGTRVLCHAVGAGAATLIIEDHAGQVRSRAYLRVEVPTRIEFRPMVAQRFGREPALVLPSRAAVVVLDGGVASFSLHYFKGSQELVGRPELTLEIQDVGLLASTLEVGDHQVLQVSAFQVSRGSLALWTGDRLLQSAVFQVVEPDDLWNVWIDETPYDQRTDGEPAKLWLRAEDGQGREVFGLQVSWHVAEAPAVLAGDPVFGYLVDISCHTEVTASVAHRQAATLAELTSSACREQTNVLASCGTRAGGDASLFCLMLMGAGWLARPRRPR